MSVFIVVLITGSCTKPDYKKVADDFIKSSTPLKDYTIRAVEDTASSDWKAVVVYVKQNNAIDAGTAFCITRRKDGCTEFNGLYEQ